MKRNTTLPLVWALVTILATLQANASSFEDRAREAFLQIKDAPLPLEHAFLSHEVDQAPALALSEAIDALAAAERSGDDRAEHKALLARALAEERSGLYAEFLQTILRALDVAQAMGDPKLIATDLQHLSFAYRLNRRADSAVEEARNALAMVLPTQDDQAVYAAQTFLMATLVYADRPEEALALGDNALERVQRSGTAKDQARVWLLMGEALLASGKHNDALPYLTKADRVLDTDGTLNERFMLRMDRAQAYLAMGRLAEAEQVLASAAMLPVMDSWSHRSMLRRYHYELALAHGDHRKALDLLQHLKHQDDSLDRALVDLKMAGLQAMHQLDRKDRDNAMLRDLNARNEETIADQRVSNRYLMGSMVGLLVLAIALFVTSRYSLRMMRRMKLKNQVIRKQHDEIHAKNIELQRQNLRLAETLVSEEEKELMIKEIHHRVKNNLQVVDSLLSAQGTGVGDPVVARQFKEAQGRIRSMAMVHEHIYRAGGQVNGSLQNYLAQLSRNVLVAYGLHDRVSVSVEARMPVFPVDTLTPLSLIVNELLTNSVKYAFADRDHGHVSIVVRPAGTDYELIFKDDGVGLRNEAGFRGERSFGLELVRVLANQLNGEVRQLKGSGAAFCLTFRPDGKVMRVAS